MRAFRTIITEVTDGVIRTFIGSGEAGGAIEGEIIQQVMIKSHPKPGDSGLVLQDGNRYYLIATDNDIGPGLGEGEFVLAFDANNYIKSVVVGGVLEKIHINTDKDVEVNALNVKATATNKIEATAPTIDITAATRVNVVSTIVSLGLAGFITLVKSTFLALFDMHIHGGVTTGGGNSGPPTSPSGPTHSTVNTLAS